MGSKELARHRQNNGAQHTWIVFPRPISSANMAVEITKVINYKSLQLTKISNLYWKQNIKPYNMLEICFSAKKHRMEHDKTNWKNKK